MASQSLANVLKSAVAAFVVSLSVLVVDPRSFSIEATWVLFGSPAYASGESIQSHASFTARSQLFSLYVIPASFPDSSVMSRA